MKKSTKYATPQTVAQHALWDSFVQAFPLSALSSSAPISSESMRRLTPLKVQSEGFARYCRTKPRQVISKSMEKAFHRYMTKPSARHAFVEAETATSVAFQIKSIRKQRGWTQHELAKRLGTTQTAVCRLEDPGYGRLTVKTLIDLANVFDAGLSVEFVSFTDMVCENWRPSKHLKRINPFAEECETLAFEVAPMDRVLVNVPVDEQYVPQGRSITFDPVSSAKLINL